jgi:hypothetical protein
MAHEGIAGHSHEEPTTSKNRVEIKVEGDYRTITANGLPNHTTGNFPNRGNPNRISEQSYRFRVPLHPKKAETTTRLIRQPFGIALNGILFDPGTAEYWRNDRQSNWNYEALSGKIPLGLDQHKAHVQPNGAYHYHGIPAGLVSLLAKDKPGLTLIGYAADGFPIYVGQAPSEPKNAESKLVTLKSSYRLKKGTRPDGPGGPFDGTYTADYEYEAGLGDLDECNGREGVTPEYPDGTYYYVLTEEFPNIPRMFRGTPDPSFQRRGPGGPPPRRPGFGPPPDSRPPPK